MWLGSIDGPTCRRFFFWMRQHFQPTCLVHCYVVTATAVNKTKTRVETGLLKRRWQGPAVYLYLWCLCVNVFIGIWYKILYCIKLWILIVYHFGKIHFIPWLGGSRPWNKGVHMALSMYICTYGTSMYLCTCIHRYIYIYIYILKVLI